MCSRIHGIHCARVSFLVAALLFAGSCGTGSGGGGGGDAPMLLGGILRPNPTAYALTQTNDFISEVTGSCRAGLSILPPSVDLRRDGTIPPVQNQRWNSCVAWSLGYFAMTCLQARLSMERAGIFTDGRTAIDLTDREHWFSPDYIYAQRDTQSERDRFAPGSPNCVETDGQLGCMRPEHALRILIEEGCGKWTWMCDGSPDPAYRSCVPDDPSLDGLSSRRAWGPTRFGAEDFKPACYVRFGVLDEGSRLPVREMQAWLFERRTPISIVVKMTQGWVGYRGENPATVTTPGFLCDVTEPRTACLDAVGQDLGSQHMMSVIGYDDTFPSAAHYPGLPPEKTGSFLIVNQWGTKWGDNGYMWIPYAELEKLWVAAYAIQPPPPGGPPAADEDAGECVQDETGRWENLSEENDVPRNRTPGTPVGAPLQHPRDTTATELALGDVVPFDSVGESDPADWYYIETTEPNTWIEVTASSGSDVDMKLTDQEGRLVALSATVIAEAPSETMRRLLCDPGVYFLKVYSRDGSSLFYGLTIDPVADPGTDDDICNATLVEAVCLCGGVLKPESGSTQVVGGAGSTVGGGDPCDWWQVIAPVTGQLDVLVRGAGTQADVWRGTRPDQAALVARAFPIKRDRTEVHVSVPAVEGQRFFIQVRPAPVFDDDGDRVDPPEVEYTLFVQTGFSLPDDTPGGARPLTLRAVEPDVPLDPTLSNGGHHAKWEASTVGFLTERNPLDYHRFFVPANRVFRVRLTEVDAGAEVFASSIVNGFLANTLDPPSDEFLSQSRAEPAAGSEVLIAVGSCDGSETRYRLTVELYFGEAEETDGRRQENERTLDSNRSRSELIGGGDVDDWFRIVDQRDQAFDATGAATITLTGACAGLTFEVVQERATGVVAVPMQGVGGVVGAQVKRVDLPEPDDGPVWVCVRAPAGQAPTNYVLTMAFLKNPAGIGGVNVPSNAQPLALGTAQAGTVGRDDARDFYRLELPAGTTGPVTLNLTGLTGRVRLSVSDDAGQLCGGDRDACQANNEPPDFGVPVPEDIQLVVPNVPGGTKLTVMIEVLGRVDLAPEEIPYTLRVTSGVN